MLVLSRRPNEKIVFPTLGVTVQVVALKPGLVRLGIDAPHDVTVLREEVLERTLQAGQAAIGQPPIQQLQQLNHLLRNRLNSTTIGLALLRRQMQAGLRDGMESTLAKIDSEINSLRQQVEGTLDAIQPRPPTRPRKALLVEDDQNECELLAGFLRLAGLEVITAHDGCDALDYLRRDGRPDVMLLDMILPRCDGLSTVKAIRKEPSLAGLKIFAVTGSSPTQFPVPHGPEGVDRWFAKPLNPEALLNELHRELGQ
jgi:two-component system, OmpR family, response regulator